MLPITEKVLTEREKQMDRRKRKEVTQLKIGFDGSRVSVFCDGAFDIFKLENLSLCNLTIESCIEKITIDQDKYIVIIGIYRPHSETAANLIFNLEIHLNNEVINCSESVLIVVDLNINISEINSNASINLSPVLNRPITRHTRFPSVNSNVIPTFLDHIWMNNLVAYKSGIKCMDTADRSRTKFYIFQSSP